MDRKEMIKQLGEHFGVKPVFQALLMKSEQKMKSTPLTDMAVLLKEMENTSPWKKF